MRGFLIGLLLVPALVISVLSLRPGGLRNQLRNIVRRFKLALILGGIYLLASGVLRLLLRDGTSTDLAIAAVAVVLTVIFLFLGQERQLDP